MVNELLAAGFTKENITVVCSQDAVKQHLRNSSIKIQLEPTLQLRRSPEASLGPRWAV